MRDKLIRKAVLLRRNPETTAAWEYPNNAQQGYDFIALLAAIRIHLPEDRYILTTALPASKAVLQYIDFKVAAEYLDHLNLMAYDFFGPWSSKSGHHAQLYSLNRDDTSGSSGVAYLLSHGFPARKILLGVPTHGRSFLGVAGAGHRFRGGGGEDGAFEYHQLPRPGCAETVDKRHVAAVCLGGDGGFVTYDNPETVKTKAGFCKQKGLAVSPKSSSRVCIIPRLLFPLLPAFWRWFLSLGAVGSQNKTWQILRRVCRTLAYRCLLGAFLLERTSRFQRKIEKSDCRRLPCPTHLLGEVLIACLLYVLLSQLCQLSRLGTEARERKQRP